MRCSSARHQNCATPPSVRASEAPVDSEMSNANQRSATAITSPIASSDSDAEICL